MNYQIESIKTEAFEMEYLRFGEGKKTLVILPGLSVQSVLLSAGAIAKQYELFSKDFTVFLFDRRKDLPQKYPVSAMAEDTANAMKTLGLSGTCLFGASQGGMIAMSIAIDSPALVSKLALGSTDCRIEPDRCEVIDHWIELAKEARREDLYLSFGERIYPKEIFERYRRALRFMSKRVTKEELERFTVLAEGSRGFDVSSRLCEIRCPTLLISDSEDRVIRPEAAEEIAAQLCENPDFEHRRYHGFGHAAYDTAPDYTQRLYDFFMR